MVSSICPQWRKEFCPPEFIVRHFNHCLPIHSSQTIVSALLHVVLVAYSGHAVLSHSQFSWVAAILVPSVAGPSVFGFMSLLVTQTHNCLYKTWDQLQQHCQLYIMSFGNECLDDGDWHKFIEAFVKCILFTLVAFHYSREIATEFFSVHCCKQNSFTLPDFQAEVL